MFSMYVIKFLIGGIILVAATFFSQQKNLFLAGIITTLPLMTIANMVGQTKILNKMEFRNSTLNGIWGGIGLALFVFFVYLLSYWFKPIIAIGLGILLFLIYIFVLKIYIH